MKQPLTPMRIADALLALAQYAAKMPPAQRAELERAAAVLHGVTLPQLVEPLPFAKPAAKTQKELDAIGANLFTEWAEAAGVEVARVEPAEAPRPELSLAAAIRGQHLAHGRKIAAEVDDGFLKMSAGIDRLIRDRAELVAALHYLIERDARSPFLSPGDEQVLRAALERVQRP